HPRPPSHHHPGLGHGHVLAPSAGGARSLATPRQTSAAALRPGVLGTGISDRNVRRGHIPNAEGDPPGRTRVAATGRASGCAGDLDFGVCWPSSPPASLTPPPGRQLESATAWWPTRGHGPAPAS